MIDDDGKVDAAEMQLILLREDKSNLTPRRSPRRPTAIRAQIITGDGRIADCMIRNVSDHGAKLGLSPTFDLPPDFKLRMCVGSRSIRVRLVWRSGSYAGVMIGGQIVQLPERDELGDQTFEV